MVVLMDPMEDPDDILRAHRSREKSYLFDVAFDFTATQVRGADPCPTCQGALRGPAAVPPPPSTACSLAPSLLCVSPCPQASCPDTPGLACWPRWELEEGA